AAANENSLRAGIRRVSTDTIPRMGDWRQIQGRIRRARTSADPAGKLNELFQKTRDAMVAFEAGALEEKSGRSEEAVRWYTIAAQRFRRVDWRQKAAEALTRLGAPVPEVTTAGTSSQPQHAEENGGEEMNEGAESQLTADESGEVQPTESGASETQSAASAGVHVGEGARRPGRRRGRRGGRRHRRGSARRAAGQSPAHAPTHGRTQAHHAAHPRSAEQAHAAGSAAFRGGEETAVVESAQASAESSDVPTARFVPEPAGPFAERVTYIRAGDPALASRFAHLESLLRRLISAPLHRVDELEDAPAGPGVFLLSDSDLTTNYYVEACQTLRIGTAQLARAGRAGKGARTEGKSSLRSQMAEHLEINDSQVSDYLKKHCVVRWLQLDENASHVAHFAIALLRPALNTD